MHQEMWTLKTAWSTNRYSLIVRKLLVWLMLESRLLLSSWKRYIIPGICGILGGSLYQLNFVLHPKIEGDPGLLTCSIY
ncbi:hypothetical protein ACET3Z_010555 [Daucus carota]